MATIWDESNHTNYLLIIRASAQNGNIVPELTLSMPAKITLSSGLDAISHAIESYWSKHTNRLWEIAYRAIELIVQNLREAIEEPYNLIIRKIFVKLHYWQD